MWQTQLRVGETFPTHSPESPVPAQTLEKVSGGVGSESSPYGSSHASEGSVSLSIHLPAFAAKFSSLGFSASGILFFASLDLTLNATGLGRYGTEP